MGMQLFGLINSKACRRGPVRKLLRWDWGGGGGSGFLGPILANVYRYDVLICGCAASEALACLLLHKVSPSTGQLALLGALIQAYDGI